MLFGRASLRAAQMTGSAGVAQVTETIPGQTKLDIRGYSLLSDPSGAGNVPIMSLYANGSLLGSVSYRTDPVAPALTVYNAANDSLFACHQVPKLNAWHSLELQYALSTCGGGSVALWLDGARVCAASELATSPWPKARINTVVMGVDSAEQTAGLTVHIDDVIIGTSRIRP